MEKLNCLHCDKPTPLNEVGASYIKAGEDIVGEWCEASIVCAECEKRLEEWCEEEGKKLDAQSLIAANPSDGTRGER